ncbi:MAG: HD domain-containing protein, partial [Planctomycetes bacterium]|nr:HD domain-containing protein [Planctomycetota bacterium]
QTVFESDGASEERMAVGGPSSRYGSVIITELPEPFQNRLTQHLQRGRFLVADPASDSDTPIAAVLVWLDADAGLGARIQKLRLAHPDAAILGLCQEGENTSRALLCAIRLGIRDALFVDGDLEELIPALKLAIECVRLECEARLVSDDFTRELGRKARDLRDAYGNMEQAYEETLNALVAALDVREKATARHSVRVAYYTCWLASRLGYTTRRLMDVYRGSLLHDIGKIGIPDSILLKPGQLTVEEFEVMKSHTEIGRIFIEGVAHLCSAIDIPYCHHEKWNGKGYPRGLVGEDIPLAARIFAVCDVYDALRSKRCYKDAMSFETAVGILQADSGTHFDPVLIELFMKQGQETWEGLDLASREGDPCFETMLKVFRRMEATPRVPVDAIPVGDVA